MRAAPFVAMVCMALASSACVPDRNAPASWQKPPAAWNPKGDELTFGQKSFEAFNGMSAQQRSEFVEALQQKPGAFRGQGRFQSASELAEGIDDRQYGKYELLATLDEPILFEVTVDYELFSNEKIGKGLPQGAYLDFTGTVVDVQYRDDSKPRKLVVKVKDATVNRLQD